MSRPVRSINRCHPMPRDDTRHGGVSLSVGGRLFFCKRGRRAEEKSSANIDPSPLSISLSLEPLPRNGVPRN